MIPIISHHQYTCGSLQKSDRDVIANFITKRESDAGQTITANTLQMRVDEYLAPSVYKRLALFDNDKMVGVTLVDTHNGEFTNFYILNSHREKHLSSMLYDACIHYILDKQRHRRAKVCIPESNEFSWKAALGNGFSKSYQDREDTYIYYLPLDDLRAFRQAQVESGSYWDPPFEPQ